MERKWRAGEGRGHGEISGLENGGGKQKLGGKNGWLRARCNRAVAEKGVDKEK